MSATFLFLPPGDGDGPLRWARAENGTLVEGDGVPPDLGEVVAVAPADAVALHWAELPSRSLAQATAAARLLAAEASATPLAELHVAVGNAEAEARGGAGDGRERPIALAEAGAVRAWLERLARDGVDPAALVPAPMLLPDPGDDWVRAELGGQGLVRGPGSGFADDARLTELMTGGIAPDTLTRDALAAALSRPSMLDLRQGSFARRRRAGIDWSLVRRLAVLAGAILLVTVATDAVRLLRYDNGADTLEARADAVARGGLPRGQTVTDASRQLDERLRELRGPGRGFSASAALAAAAVQATPDVELTSFSFQPDGTVRLGVAALREAGPTDLRRTMQRSGLVVEAGTFTNAGGRVTGEFTVRTR